MSKGFDTPNNPIGKLTRIKADGIGFVGMYYFHSSGYKTLLTAEIAYAIAGAGMYIVSVWESGYPTTAGYFTGAQGSTDAAGAVGRAKEAGQPDSTPIYFAVDGDVPPSAIDTYFRTLAPIVHAAGYTVGVYASGAVCAHLAAEGLVSHTWLSQSRGWSGYASWRPHADLVQGVTASYHGLDVDWDESPNGRGGGWIPAVS